MENEFPLFARLAVTCFMFMSIEKIRLNIAPKRVIANPDMATNRRVGKEAL